MASHPVVAPAPSAFDPGLLWSLHRSKIIGAAVIVALLLVGLGLTTGLQAWHRQKAEAAYAAAENSGDWESVIRQYPGSTAAGNAALRLAAKLAADGNYPASDGVYESFLRQNPKHPLAVNGAMGLAQNAENEKNSEKALKGYADVVARFGTSYLAPLALFHEGRLTRDKGQWKEARELFERVVQSYPGSFAAALANQEASKLNDRLNPPASPAAAPAASASPEVAKPTPAP